MAEGPYTDPATFGDTELLRRAREGTDPGGPAELRRRHLHGLTTVAAGYVRSLNQAGTPTRADPEAVVDAVFADLGALPEPAVDGDVFLILCAAVRLQVLGEVAAGDPPRGLADLLDSSGASDAEAVAAAYGSLDERDRVLLWFIAAESALPNQLARKLSIGGGDRAAAMAHRARSALRQAYLDRRDETNAACAAARERLVEVTDAPGHEDRTHLMVCPACRQVLAELHGLPNELSAHVAAIIARSSVPAPVTAPATRTGPMLITTTPMLDETRAVPLPGPVPVADSTASTEAVSDPGSGAEDSPGRRRAVILAVVGVFLVAAVAGAAFLFSNGSSDGPSDAGFPADQPASTTVAPSTSSTSTSTSSTTTSTTTTVPPTAPPETEPPVTVPPTPAPAPQPEAPQQPQWSPPAQEAPATPAPTDPAPTDPPSTPSPPTDPAEPDGPEPADRGSGTAPAPIDP